MPGMIFYYQIVMFSRSLLAVATKSFAGVTRPHSLQANSGHRGQHQRRRMQIHQRRCQQLAPASSLATPRGSAHGRWCVLRCRGHRHRAQHRHSAPPLALLCMLCCGRDYRPHARSQEMLGRIRTLDFRYVIYTW